MQTRDKIVEDSLLLFNTRGTDLITVRHIAKQMGISHGNLCYHFPRKEDIIYQLYLNLVTELDAEIGQLQEGALNIKQVMESVGKTFAIQYKYKFILTDFVAIMRNIPEIQTHFQSLFVRRKTQFSALIDYLIQAGYFQEEQYPGQYDVFIHQFYILGDFWIAESEILFRGSDEEKLTHYIRIAGGLVYVYLTERGRQEMQDLMK